jgi:signal transduction histidine kinase
MNKKNNNTLKPNATLKEAVQGRNNNLPPPETILGIDIEQLKHNLDLFKYSLDYAEAIVNTVREPLVILNKDLQVLTANRAFYQTFQLLPEKLENKPFYELGNGELNIPKFRKLLGRVLSKGASFEDFEIEYTMPKLGKRILLLNARKFYRQINATQTILLAIEDVTKIRNYEKQKDEFASIIMHELKGPVSTINGNVQLLHAHLSNRDDKKLLKYTDNIEEQVHRLTSLINGLLNSSRIRAVGFEFKDRIFDIDELLKQTVDDLQKTTKSHHIVLDGLVQKYVRGDRDRIAQVLINLLTNAIKYSPNSADISVSVTLNQNKVIISVKDSGIGISSINQKKVFDRFFKLNAPTQETFYGIGLGLDISSQIIRHHKGRIWLESSEGKGSQFNFSLPVHQT